MRSGDGFRPEQQCKFISPTARHFTINQFALSHSLASIIVNFSHVSAEDPFGLSSSREHETVSNHTLFVFLVHTHGLSVSVFLSVIYSH